MRNKPRYPWRPMVRANALKAPSWELISATMTHLKIDQAAAMAHLEKEIENCEWWLNDIYQVEVRRDVPNKSVHLNIRRRDGGPILRDWRHFQRIKNEIVGEECEAVELYPAESRLVDTSNKFHLWCSADPTFRFPFGFPNRQTHYESGDTPGLKQRAL